MIKFLPIIPGINLSFHDFGVEHETNKQSFCGFLYLAVAEAHPGLIHPVHYIYSIPTGQQPQEGEKMPYVDFNGAVVTGSAWNNFNGGADIIAVPFNLDGDPNTFIATELQRIQNIWKRVTEGCSLFDMDVTIEEPAHAYLRGHATQQ